MSLKTKNRGFPGLTQTLTATLLAGLPLAASCATWQLVATEQGKRIEINRETITSIAPNTITALGRIVLDRAIVDPRTSTSYQSIEILNRYDCKARNYATLKRSYFREDSELLRQEDMKMPYDMPVRSGTPDDQLFREACRPSGVNRKVEAGQTISQVNTIAAELRQHNEALVEKEVKKDTQRLAQQANALLNNKNPHSATPPSVAPLRKAGTHGAAKKPPVPPVRSADWSYSGSLGPDNWGSLGSEYALCAFGQRQSPIDIRDGFAVDLEPIQFVYKPSAFRVVDSGRSLDVFNATGGLNLLGKTYALIQIRFHRPSEMAVNGTRFDMDAQLIHRAQDGALLIVSVFLEQGAENPAIQAALNNLPLERGGELSPPGGNIDIEQLLPKNRGYYTFMGSLTTPPCAENVLWLVLKQAQSLSPEQLSIFTRLYPPNARPLQADFGRIIKESR